MRGVATYHSLDRVKDRQNVKNKRAAKRVIARAIEKGKRAEDFSSWERDYLLNEARDDCIAIAYNGFCYIVNHHDVCVTLYPLPAWFGKKKHFDGKERIKDYKKYQQNAGERYGLDELEDEPGEDRLSNLDELIDFAEQRSVSERFGIAWRQEPERSSACASAEPCGAGRNSEFGTRDGVHQL